MDKETFFIDNQEFYIHDTVFCISKIGNEYRGTLDYIVEYASLFIVVKKDKNYNDFTCVKMRPLRMVLTEKVIKNCNWYSDGVLKYTEW